MIRLDDPRWGDLEHAYGKADDTPTHLETLRKCESLPHRWQDEPLSALWESLCHQGDPCTAAYAAVPHLIDIVAARSAGEGETVLHLVGSIAAHKHRGPKVPDWLAEAYSRALSRAAEVIGKWLSQGPVAPRSAFLLLADHAAFSGKRMLARALMALESGEGDFQCTFCGERAMLGVAESGLDIAPLTWVRRTGDVDSDRTYSEWASSLGHSALARQFTDLDGTFECPACGRELRAIDAIVAAYP